MNRVAVPLPPQRPDLVVFDFDGVMTDNRVILREDGLESVVCNRGDGLGVGIIRGLGISQIILSTETNPVVAARARKLDLPVIHGTSDKRRTLREYCDTNGISPERVFYVGNDTNDREVMGICGFRICPADAHPAILAIADLVTNAAGGTGVVRELADLIYEAYFK